MAARKDQNKTTEQLLKDAKAHCQKASWLLLRSGMFEVDDEIFHYLMRVVSGILAREGMRSAQLEIDWWYEENPDQSE